MSDFNGKSVYITGKFTEEDWKELVDCIRQIERRHPDTHYNVVVGDKDNNMSLEEAIEFVNRNYPRIPGEDPFIGYKQNDIHRNN